MNAAEFESLIKHYSLACEVCNGQRPSDESLRITIAVFKKYPAKDVKSAIDDHVQAVIDRLVTDRDEAVMSVNNLLFRLEGDPLSEALHAWKEFLPIIWNWSRDTAPKFSFEMTGAAVENSGGLYDYSMMLEAETEKWRKRFIESYLYCRKNPREAKKLLEGPSKGAPHIRAVIEREAVKRSVLPRITEKEVGFFEQNLINSRNAHASMHRPMEENERRLKEFQVNTPGFLEREEKLKAKNRRIVEKSGIKMENLNDFSAFVENFKRQMEEDFAKEDAEREKMRQENEEDDMPF